MLFLLLQISCAPKYKISAIENNETLPQTSTFETIEGKIVKTYDKDNNGIVDVRSYQDAEDGPIVLRSLDLNQDGRDDIRTKYNDDGIIEEQFDGDFDGVIDIIDYYDNNERIESHIDTNSDKTFDVFRIYENGVLRSERLDVNYDSVIDTIYTYDNNGNRKEE